MPEVTIEAELRTESGNGLPAVPVVLAASPELSTATGPRPLNPRARGSSPWQRTRPELGVYLFRVPS